jgi:N-acetylmuramoyl-L-alanine amidase
LRQLSNGYLQDAYGNTKNEDDFPHGIVYAPCVRAGSGTFAWPRYTPEQLSAVDDLTAALCQKYSIMDIVSHEEIDTRGWKTDPGPAFPMQLVKRHLTTDRGNDFEKWEVTASSLRVRSGPGSQYETVRSLVTGQQVEVINRNSEWVQIDNDGWVHGGYLRRV